MADRKHTILCVDDEVDNVDALERIFRKKYEVLKATSGADALKLIERQKVAVIISDQRMPNMTGVEFLNQSQRTNPDSIRILLTGYTDIESVIASINTGQVYRYITKPWDPRDLEITIDRAVERYELNGLLKQKNIELEAALKELKTLDEAKSHFMILINHELKTPLTTILSYLELFSETKLDSDQKTYLDRLIKSSNRLKEIVFDVLEFVSAETGQTKPSVKKAKFASVIMKVESELAPQIDAKKQKLNTEIEVSEGVFDEKLISSVFKRILHNASKFGDEKSTIDVSIKEANGSARVSISNSGKPLSQEVISKILKPFALDENIMNHSKGVGMGLSICQALLKLHDSQLKFENSKNLTTVTFDLKS